MKTHNLIAAAAIALVTAAPAMAQTPAAPAAHPRHRLTVGHPGPDQPSGGSPGYQANTYVRQPSSRTPTDVGNMQFPDPSQTPAGRLPAVSTGG